ncbi:hypothetical protein [Streptomyces sp. A1547]|uniref:hypothetical protein n=1 Tax=Streptomyces sp. A1547 TaxID=2563105 RepID=UPI001F10F5D7|nr:hypothetical protein [Streptomyces sp. A1547]
MVLRPPVEPMLAQAAESVPGPAALRSGVAYEQKLDGHRALLFTAAEPGGLVLVQTRRGSLVQDRFPDLVAAAEQQLPHGLSSMANWSSRRTLLGCGLFTARVAPCAGSLRRKVEGSCSWSGLVTRRLDSGTKEVPVVLARFPNERA